MIHEDLRSAAVEPHLPLYFCGEVGLLYRLNDLLFEVSVYILIEIVDLPLLLMYFVSVGLC